MQKSNSIVKKGLLGEILVNRNIISQQQLEQALEIQNKEKVYLGEILVRLGFAEEIDIVAALVVQCNFPYIAVNKCEIDKSILYLIPEDVARKHQVVPLDRVGEILSVVMIDPFDLVVRTELQRITNCKITVFITTKKEMSKALERLYNREN